MAAIINPFKPNGISHYNQLDQSKGWSVILFILFRFQYTILLAQSGNLP